MEDLRQGNEAETLCWALERVHQQFAWKTGGLNAEQLRRQHAPSTMTLAGVIKHMASVEECWTAAAQGREPDLPWNPAEVEEDWDWHSAVEDKPEDLYALWYGVVGHTERVAAVISPLIRRRRQIGQPVQGRPVLGQVRTFSFAFSYSPSEMSPCSRSCASFASSSARVGVPAVVRT